MIFTKKITQDDVYSIKKIIQDKRLSVSRVD